MKHFLTAFVLVALSIPTVAYGSPVIRSGESVTIGQDQMVSGDLYTVGGSVSISGGVGGDVLAAAGVTTLNAPVEADVLLISGSAQIHGAVADDVRAVAGEVTLADEVGGDVVVVGGTLRILSTAVVHGDVIFFGGELIVEGPVGGSIFGSAENMRIDAAVRGSVEVHAYEELVIGDRAHIDGHVNYESSRELVRAQNAVIVGDVQHEKATLRDAAFAPETFLLPLLMLLFAGLLLYLLLKKRLPSMLRTFESNYGMHGLIGLAIISAVPFVIVILFVSVLGVFVGVLLAALYIALIVFSYVLASIAAGTWIMKRIFKSREVTVLSVGVGALLFQLLALVPLVGFLIILTLVAITVGGLARQLYFKIVRS